MALTLQDMFTPLSKDDVLASILDIANTVGLPTTSWQPGSVILEVLTVCSQKLADLTQVTSAIAAGGLLDYASGGWLTLLAKSGYGVTRIPSTFGVGSVHLANSSGSTYTIAAGDLHFLNATTGRTYTNTTGGTLTPTTGTLDLAIIADQAGTNSNAVPGIINSLVTPLVGVTVSNPLALSATDDETDTQLRQRCREKLAAASPNGAAAAYDYFAKSATRVSDGSNVGVTRTRVAQANGSVAVYVANATGPVSGTMSDPTTDLGAITLVIRTNCVPTGISTTVASAVTHNVQVQADVYLSHGSSLNATQAQALVLAQLQEYFTTVPIGGFNIGAGGRIFVDALVGQIFQASADVVQAIVTLPAADEVLAINEVAVFTSVGTDFTIHST